MTFCTSKHLKIFLGQSSSLKQLDAILCIWKRYWCEVWRTYMWKNKIGRKFAFWILSHFCQFYSISNTIVKQLIITNVIASDYYICHTHLPPTLPVSSPPVHHSTFVTHSSFYLGLFFTFETKVVGSHFQLYTNVMHASIITIMLCYRKLRYAQYTLVETDNWYTNSIAYLIMNTLELKSLSIS